MTFCYSYLFKLDAWNKPPQSISSVNAFAKYLRTDFCFFFAFSFHNTYVCIRPAAYRCYHVIRQIVYVNIPYPVFKHEHHCHWTWNKFQYCIENTCLPSNMSMDDSKSTQTTNETMVFFLAQIADQMSTYSRTADTK